MGRRENNIFSIFGVLSLLHKPVITKQKKKSSAANKPKRCTRLEGHEKVKKCLLKEFIKINLDYDLFFKENYLFGFVSYNVSVMLPSSRVREAFLYFLVPFKAKVIRDKSYPTFAFHYCCSLADIFLDAFGTEKVSIGTSFNELSSRLIDITLHGIIRKFLFGEHCRCNSQDCKKQNDWSKNAAHACFRCAASSRVTTPFLLCCMGENMRKRKEVHHLKAVPTKCVMNNPFECSRASKG